MRVRSTPPSRMLELHKKCDDLSAEVTRLKCQLGREEKDVKKHLDAVHLHAVSKLEAECVGLRESLRASNSKKKSINGNLEAARREADVNAGAAARVVELESELSEQKLSCKELRAQLARRDGMVARRNDKLKELTGLPKELEQAAAEAEALSSDQAALVREAADLRAQLARRDDMVARRDAKLKELTGLPEKLKQAAAEAEALSSDHASLVREAAELRAQSAERLLTIRRLAGKGGGRPVVNRSEEDLQQCTASVASMNRSAMCDRIAAVLGEFGTEDQVSTEVLVDALEVCGYLHAVWESKAVWQLRMEWVDELKSDLHLVWDSHLTLRMRDKLNISYEKVDELRFQLSHYRVGKQLKPRPWVKDPWTGARCNFPQPITPRSRWTPLIKAAQERYATPAALPTPAAPSYSLSPLAQVRVVHGRDRADGTAQLQRCPAEAGGEGRCAWLARNNH